MRKFTKIFVVGLALFLCQIAIQAQTTGSISGTVTDPNGAAVVGASVKLRNNETGSERSATTSDVGGFAFSLVQPGKYSVTVENAGFKKSVASDVAISVSIETQVTIKLEVGQANETVTVTATQEVINTSSPSLTNVINTKQVADLPLGARNPLDLAALQAGIAVIGNDTRGSSVAGLRQTAVYVSQDGINAMDNFVKTSSFFAISSPSLNSTDEFSITTGTVGSESGRGAAQVNLVTKGGTNSFHGNGFYLTRNSALEANSWFNNAGGNRADGTANVLRPDEHQHFYGFSIGGPIYFPAFGDGPKHIWSGKDKAFFFFSYEGFREKFAVTRNRTVMTAQARSGLFRYTGTGTSGLQTVNLLPLGNFHTLNPLTMAQHNAMPLPDNTDVGDGLNTQGVRINFQGSDPNDKYVFRYDHQLVKDTRLGSHKLEFVYNRAKFLLYPDTFNGIEAPFPGGVNAGQSSIRSLFTGALHSEFGSISNVFRYGKQWAPVGFIRDTQPTSFFINTASTTNFDNTFMSQGRNTVVNQFSDNMVIPTGNHLLRFGGDVENVFAFTFNDAGINPQINIGTNASNPDGLLQSSFPNSVSADLSRARGIYQDLVGLLASASATFNVRDASSGFVQGFTRERIFRQNNVSAFGEDQWRFRSNVTLSLGMRWEFEAVPTIPNGLAIQPKASDLFGISGYGNLFKPTAPAGPPPGVATQQFVSGNTGIGLYGNDWNNFAPFFGIAYSPNFDKGFFRTLFGATGTSSFRAGYSISYLHDGFTVVSNALGTGTTNPGLIQTSSNTTPVGVLTAAGLPLAAPAFTIPITDKQNFDLNPGNGLWAIDPKLRVPYVQQWNFGFEREIFKDTAIEVRYTGNHAIKVLRAIDFNEVNIFENGFLNEFLGAQRNLALHRAALCGTTGQPACSFGNSGLAGQVNLTNMARFFTGLAAGSAFSSSGFIANLDANNVGTFANTLSFSNTYKANRQSAAIGIPANFFVANPNAAFARLLTNDAMSNYNSLQIELRRRFSKGLQFQADYTWSKAMGNATDAQGNNQSDLVNFLTHRNKKLDYRRSTQDQTQRFIANGVYELPFGKGRSYLSGVNGVLNQIIGGWNIGAIAAWSTRPPFHVTSGRTTFTSSSANNPAQLLGITFEEFKKNLGIFRTPEGGIFFVNPAILNITYSPTTGRVTSSTLKPGLMGAPAPGTFGNFPLNSLNGPSYFNLDMSVVKRFAIRENVKLELKSSMINVLNHPNFSYGTLNFDATNFGRITTTSGGARVINFQGTMRF